jgi:hypothetical protein
VNVLTQQTPFSVLVIRYTSTLRIVLCKESGFLLGRWPLLLVGRCWSLERIARVAGGEYLMARENRALYRLLRLRFAIGLFMTMNPPSGSVRSPPPQRYVRVDTTPTAGDGNGRWCDVGKSLLCLALLCPFTELGKPIGSVMFWCCVRL